MKYKAYSTDLTDEQWKLLEPFFPSIARSDRRNGRPRKYAYRSVLDGIFYLVRAGNAWELLPHDLPPWRTCYHYFRKWSENGLLEQIHTALREQVRTAQGRETTPSAAIIDSQSIKTTEKGGSPAKTRLAMTATKKSKDANAICW